MTSRSARAALLAVTLLVVLAASAAAASAAISSHILTVAKVGNGYVSGPGIDCGGDCVETVSGDCQYEPELGEVVCTDPETIVTASDQNGFAFDHWDGCWSPPTSAICDVTLTDDTEVVAYFDDVQNPSATLTQPAAPGARTGTIALAATALDNGGVARVDFYVRNVKVGSDASAPYELSWNSATVADGPALVEAEAVDTVGRISARSAVTITIDNTDPTLSITSGPSNQTFGAGTTQTFAFTAGDAASGVQKVECKVDAGNFGACSAGNDGHSVQNLPHGTHTLTVRATDNVGRTAQQSRSWSIDAAGPTTALTKPALGGAYRGAVELAATATDGTSVQRVEFWVGGAKLPEDTSAPYSTVYDSAAAPDGDREVLVRAYDGFGNSTEQARTVTFDNTAPTVGFTSGPDGQTYGPGSTQTWAFTGADASSGLAGAVACSVDGAAFGACAAAGGHSVEGAPGGSHTLTIKAVDAAGNEATAAASWTIDEAGPVVSITSGPADGATLPSASATFAFTADEPASYRCRVYPAALTPPAYGDCSSAGGHSASGFTAGTYAFEVAGTDAFGNTGAAVKRTFVVGGAVTPGQPGGPAAPAAPAAPDGQAAPGVPAAAPPITTLIDNKWHTARGRTKVIRLATRPAAGATVTITCTGKGCPFKSKAFAATGKTVDLKPLFRKRLRAGVAIEMAISRPGWTARVLRFTTQKGNRLPKLRQVGG